LTDLLAQRRLCNMETLRRSTEMKFIGNGNEILETAKRDITTHNLRLSMKRE